MNGNRGHIIKWGHWSKRSRSGHITHHEPASARMETAGLCNSIEIDSQPLPSVHHSQKSAVLTARLQGGDPANWANFREHQCVDSFLEPLQKVSIYMLHFDVRK